MQTEQIHSILMSITCTIILSSPQWSSHMIVSRAGIGGALAAVDQNLEKNMAGYLLNQNFDGGGFKAMPIPVFGQFRVRHVSVPVDLQDRASHLSGAEKKRVYSDMLRRAYANPTPLEGWIIQTLGLTSSGVRLTSQMQLPALCLISQNGQDKKRVYICSQCDGKPLVVIHTDYTRGVLRSYLANQDGTLLRAHYRSLAGANYFFPVGEAKTDFESTLLGLMDDELALEAAGYDIDTPLPDDPN